MKKFSIAAALLALLSGCSRFTTLEPDGFESVVDGGRVFLLDVRTPEEFEEGHLVGAANADWKSEDFLDQVARLCGPERPVAVYCKGGVRSAQAAKALTKAGYTVYNLKEGYDSWTGAEKEIDDLDHQYAGTLLPQGTTVPDFTLNDLEGRPVSLSDFRGRTVVLSFWASWCPDCRAELPELKAMQAVADPEKVVFVGVSFDRAFETLREFVAENELGGVQLFDPAGKADSAIGAAYGVKWIPSLYVISPDGQVVLRTVLAAKAAAVLQGKSPSAVKFNLGNLCTEEGC